MNNELKIKEIKNIKKTVDTGHKVLLGILRVLPPDVEPLFVVLFVKGGPADPVA